MTIEEQQELLDQRKRDAETIALLNEKVDLLLKEIERLSHKKNSRNSSLPPSSDITKKSKSLRGKSSRSTGGQPGHTGHTLQISTPATETTDLKSEFCSVCGSSLANAEFTLNSTRRVIDWTPPPPTHHEYRQYSCTCGKCNHVQTADYPSNVTAPIQYGSNVHAVVSYLSAYQYTPFKRMTQLMSDLLGLPMSQGTIRNILRRSAQRAILIYNEIKANIQSASVIGSDETGVAVNGKKWWVWIWQTTTDSYISISKTRGYKAITEQFEKGFPKAVLVSDRWAAQLKTTAFNHQICLAHLLRDIIFVEETEKSEFIEMLKSFVLDIFEYKRNQTEVSAENFAVTESFENRLNRILALTIFGKKHPHAHKFQRALLKVRGNILPCIYDPDIPPDNNGSERGIRNIKVKQKVSGQFKSGHEDFCILRSVIDTLIKRGHPLFKMLSQIMALPPKVLPVSE